jgi:ABC-type transport system substrate-binding protein
MDESGGIIAGTTLRWKIEDDVRKVMMELNPKARFHDDSPITTDDVAFSIARHFWKDSKSAVANYLKPILTGAEQVANGSVPRGIQVIDKHHISFQLLGPYPPFLKLLAMPGFSIVPKNFDPGHRPIVGSGPMKVKAIHPDGSIELEINEAFHGIPPRAKSLCLLHRSGLSAITAAISAQQADVSLGVPFSELDSTPLPHGVHALKTESLVINHLFLNPTYSPFADKRARELVGNLIRSIAGDPTFRSRYLELQSTFIPRGVMPRDYYLRQEAGLSADDFKYLKQVFSEKPALRLLLLNGGLVRRFWQILLKLSRK